MAKRIYNMDRFDGGITNDTRNTEDLTKCAFISHFDIYREPNRMFPMPGYVSDSGVNFDTAISDAEPDDPNGMKQYGCKALFIVTQGQSSSTIGILTVGTRADGTGWKIFAKGNPENPSWFPNSYMHAEGSETLVPNTYLTSDDPGSPIDLYFITINGGKVYISEWDGGTFNPQLAQLLPTSSYTSDNRMVVEGANGQFYAQRLASYQDVWLLSAAPAEAKNTDMYPYDLQSGDDQLGIIGQQNNSTIQSRLLLWDTASTLVDQNILLGNGTGRAVGFIDGTWVTVTEEAFSRTPYAGAGLPSMHIQYVVGGIPYTLARVYAKTTTSGKVQPVRSYYRNSFLFEGVIPTDSGATEFRQGIWAVGKATPNSPLALSLLWDTTDLGDIQDFKMYGNYGIFIHGGDGSISRTGNLTTGTFDQTAVHESLFFGSESPNNKVLNGISVHTENLPSGGTVEVKYKTDDDSAWTSLGTSTTTGQQVHSFTSESLGTFQEIQFRTEITGNAPVKNIHVSLDELDSTPYDS